MNKIIILLVYITQTINLFAQPVDEPVFINEIAYSKPFLHLVTDEKYFAKYAIEAHNDFFELMEPIKCKLHIPTGINKIWQDAESSNQHNKGEYDYSKDFGVGIRFNFYVGGVLVSTAYENVERPLKDTSSLTFYFNLDPLDFEHAEGDINYAYIEFLKNIKKKGSYLGIEAALSSKNLNQKKFAPIAYGSFHLRYDDVKYGEWLALVSDYNIQLKQLADSTMKSIFGEIGFSKYFTMSCLQNPCVKGYKYANTLVSNNPCASEPQDSCKEAIVTYNFVKKDVPLTIKMLITIKENGNFVNIENNQYGKNEIPIEKQNLLSITDIQKIINKKFPKDSLEILPFGNALGYSNARVKQPEYKDEGNKLNRDPGYRLIRETKAGKNWENGFIYRARSKDPRKSKRIYHFDAVTGKLLWITEIYKVTTENHSH
jgi:hypothetical protein